MSVRTGKVSISRKILWPPVLDGRLPAFLASEVAYDGPRYRVLSHPYTGTGGATITGFSTRAARAMRAVSAAIDPSLGAVVAGLLAAERACVIRFSDTIPGGYYAFARVAQSRAALAYRFTQLGALAPGFLSSIYSGASGVSPTTFVSREIAARGCRDVLLYVAGGGYAAATAVNIGIGLVRGGVRHRDVTLAAVRGLVASHPTVHFELVLDAPHSSGFQALIGLRNVLLVATPRAPGGGSFTYLPEALIGGRVVANRTDPLRLLQLTDRLAFGLDRVIGDSAEVAQIRSLYRAGRIPSAMAYLLARAFALGGSVDFAAGAGVGSPPQTTTSGFSAGPPPPTAIPVVTANRDSYATSNDSPLSVNAVKGVLANDSDSAHNALVVDELNGAAGTTPLHGVSAMGAAVTMNADGSFTYDPTTSSSLRALIRGETAVDTFTYRADDGNGGTATGTVTITVTGANKPPVLSNLEPTTLAYDAGTAPTPITSTLTVADPDDTSLAGATVKVGSGFVAGEDSLLFTNQNGITGTYDPATGVLTLAGSSSLANYQAALRSVAFADPSGTNPTTGMRTISFQADDGHSVNNLSNVVARQVSVNPNSPPIAGNVSASTDKHTAIHINVLANDGDPDGDTLSVASVDTTGTKGSVSINPNGTIHYDPNGQFQSLLQGQTATDTFTYKASDGFHDSNSATVTVTINGVNDPPVLANVESGTLQYFAGTPGVPVTSALTVSSPVTTTLAGATVSISSGLAAGEDSLGLTNQNGITGSYNSSTGVLTLTGTSSVANYQAALRSVTYSDSNGTTPSTGPRTIGFQVDDGLASSNLSNVASRTVNVNPNNPPIAGNVSASTDKHTAIDINVLASASDPDGDVVTLQSVNTTATKGSVSINPDSTVHYDPNGQFQSLLQGQTATDTFTYTVSDGYFTATATVTVTINGVNDPPVLANIESGTLQYTAGTPAVPVTSSLTATSADTTTLTSATVTISSGFAADEDSLGFTNQNGITSSYNSSTGVLTLTGTSSVANYQAALRSVTYSDSNGTTPSTGPRTVSFQVDDGLSGGNNLSNVASRTINVNPNSPPTAGDVRAATDKNTAIDVNVLSSASDVDGDTLSVASVDTTGTKGLVSINSNGTIHYDPNGQFDNLLAGQTATDTFTYTVSDGFFTATGTVTVTINGVNDPPVLANIESSTLQYDAGTSPAQITSSSTASSADTTTLAGATVTISSGLAASEDSLGFTNQNGITGSYNSSTGVLTLTGTAAVADYQAALRSVTYSDPNGTTPSTGPRTISFQVDDGLSGGNNLSNTVSRTINVNPNSPPSAADVSASTDKHTAIDINVLSSASDSDGDVVTVQSVNTAGTKGSASINSNGTIHYDPNGQFQNLLAGQTATDTFTYTVSDGFFTATGTVTVTINGVNDPPVLANIESSTLQAYAGSPPVPVTSSLTTSSPDTLGLVGATVTISSGLAPSEDSLGFANQNGITGSYNSATGVLTLTGTASVAAYQQALRSVTYSDSNVLASTTGPRTITFQVDDGLSGGNNLSNVASRTINVNPNSPPTAGSVSASTDKHTAIDVNVLSSASDPDGDAVTLQSVDNTGTKGLVSINPNSTVHYDPNGQFQNLTNGQTATDTFTYTVSDGLTTATGTVTVTINGVNDPVVISNVETTPLSYRAQDPAVAMTSSLTLADDDDATIASATVSITSGFKSGADTLGFTNQDGITGSYSSSTGVLTLSGNASLANYQAALRSVTFFTSDNSVSPASRAISFAATDTVGGSTTTPATRTINVAEANQPPVATNASYSAVGNTTLGVGTNPTAPAVTVNDNLLNHASDPDSGGSVTVTGHTSPAHGSVTVNPDGTFTYLPNAGFSGTDTFTYTVTDSDDSLNPKSATATVTITVGTLVWYVDDSKTSAGDGRSSSPFNTLAAANSAAGANSIIFLYQGNATYTGGVTLHSGEDLFGQPHGLTVGGFSLVAAGGSTPTITNSGGTGITLAEGSDVEAVNVSSPSGNGVAASSVNNSTVGGTNAVAISGAGGNGINISAGSGTLNFGNTSVTGSTGHSVSVASRTGGTATFDGNITDHGTGITLSGNSGATITFGGALTLSTGTSTAFSATGGGTVTATGTGSTISTTIATALNVSSTNIGSSGLNFQSISSNGANPGINLSTTGTSGGLTVAGAGSAGSGGTIQSSTGEGINLSSTSSPSFTDMVIKNNGADGISGSSVSGFTLAGSTLSGNGTYANISGYNQDGLDFTGGLTGTVTISNSTVTNSADSGLQVTDSSGNLNLTITGSTFSDGGPSVPRASDPLLGDGVEVLPDGSTSATVSVTSSTFTTNTGYHFAFQPASLGATSGTNSVTFNNNTLSNSTGVGNGGASRSPATVPRPPRST